MVLPGEVTVCLAEEGNIGRTFPGDNEYCLKSESDCNGVFAGEGDLCLTGEGDLTEILSEESICWSTEDPTCPLSRENNPLP